MAATAAMTSVRVACTVLAVGIAGTLATFEALFRLRAFFTRLRTGVRVQQVGVGVVVRTPRLGTRRVATPTAAAMTPMTATLVPRAAMLGPATRILVRRVFARLAGLFGTRGVIAFLDLELRRLREFDA